MSDITLSRWGVTIPEGSKSYQIEAALRESTSELNSTPLKVNKVTWMINRDYYQAAVEGAIDALRRETGIPTFRPNATTDVADLLFRKMGLPIQRKTQGGAASVDRETLTILAQQGHDIARRIADARELMTKLSQLNAWAPYAEAGTVQTHWDQLGQPHGRYTSDNPNLQNRINEIRHTIEAPDGHLLLSADLGQAEYVTWASLSNDPTLKAAFADGKDFHTEMWEELKRAQPNLDIPGEDNRKKGKTANFALLYLMQEWTLAQRLGITTEEARKIFEAYEERAPKAIEYQRAYVDEFTRTGIATTHFGRIREIKEITNPNIRAAKHHELAKTLWHHHNAGTAAEILKYKQAKTHQLIKKAGLRARLILQMHDELIYVVPEEELQRTKDLILFGMTSPIKDFIPFAIIEKVGKTWLDTSK